LSLSNEDQIRLHNSRLASLHEGLQKCAAINSRPVSVFEPDRTNPRAVPSTPDVLIRNASLIDGDGKTTHGVSILLSEGVIKDIAFELSPPEGARVIDARGRYVTPGIVDMVYHAPITSEYSTLTLVSTLFQNCSAWMTRMKLPVTRLLMYALSTQLTPPTRCSLESPVVG
jgi:hypothetical protein